MPINHFMPKPGRFGVAPVVTQGGDRGTSTLTATNTTAFYVPLAYRKGRISKISAVCSTLPAATTSGQTIVANAYKVVSGTTDVQLHSSSLDLEAMTAKIASPMVLTGTESSRKYNAGDCVRVDVVASAAVDTNPIDLYFVVESELES